MSVGTRMVKQNFWPIIYFFTVTTAIAVIGTPLYIYYFGVSLPEVILFLFYFVVTGLSISAGYHRLYAHATFKAHKIVQFFILFFGAAAVEQSALTWSSGHRDHHRYVDTDKDPYSIKKGFWYAHIGWMTLWKQIPDYTNAKDLLKDKLAMHQHHHYVAWGFVAGILLPVLIGALTGHALGAFILAVCLRLTLVYHSTFSINSICHKFGKSTYDIHSSAKDNWAAALITYGEGYHNFHHHFPTDYRNGVKWYHWDPSKWLIVLLARLGLVRNLQKVSNFSISQAKLHAEKQALNEKLERMSDKSRAIKMKEVLEAHYTLLINRLLAWEKSAKSYQTALSTAIAGVPGEIKAEMVQGLEKARADYQKIRGEWGALAHSLILEATRA